MSDDPLDLMAFALREDDPPPLGHRASRALVERAAREAERHKRARFSRIQTIALAFAAAAVVTLAFLVGRNSVSESAKVAVVDDGRVSTLRFETGDEIAFLSGAVFDAGTPGRAHRMFALERGDVLFDVASVDRGGSFEVRTPDAAIRVHGTVFVVSVHEDGTLLHVIEGEVAFAQAGRTRFVAGGERAGALDRSAPVVLLDLGRDAAERRLREEAPAVAEITSTDPGAAPRVAVAIEEPVRRAPRPVLRVSTARRWLEAGRADRALRAAELAVATDPDDGDWRMLRADALRALGSSDAARAYEEAARHLPWSQAAQAGYLAAHLRRAELGDRAGALEAIERTAADAMGSPLEEPALVLRTRILAEERRFDEARMTADRYLARYPEGGAAAWMRELVARVDAQRPTT
jgi:hypothetical protein